MGGCWLAMRWATYIPVLDLVTRGERGHPYVARSAEVLNSAIPTCLLRPSGGSTFHGEHTRCGGCQTDHQSCHQRSECRLIPPPISAGCHLARQPAPGAHRHLLLVAAPYRMSSAPRLAGKVGITAIAHGRKWHFSDLAIESSIGLLCGVSRRRSALRRCSEAELCPAAVGCHEIDQMICSSLRSLGIHLLEVQIGLGG